MVPLLVLAWRSWGLGPLALVGVVVVAGLLAYEQALVRPDDLSRINAAFFTVNGWGQRGPSWPSGPPTSGSAPSWARRIERAVILVGMRRLGFSLLAALAALPLAAQPEGWTRPFPGHRVIGNLYAVGTYDLGVFLIASDEGHVLINTALADSVPLIRRNIESVGYRMEDIKILLTMQAHWDHTAALAEIKDITGAALWATARRRAGCSKTADSATPTSAARCRSRRSRWRGSSPTAM